MKIRIMHHRLSVEPISDGFYLIGTFPWSRRKLIRARGNTAAQPRLCAACRRRCPPTSMAYRPVGNPPHQYMHRTTTLCAPCVEESKPMIRTTTEDECEGYEWMRLFCNLLDGTVYATYRVEGLPIDGSQTIIEDYHTGWSIEDVLEAAQASFDIDERDLKLIEIVDAG